ncbi:uncharacterized protein EV420DRAFT_1558989 [Desarmillaria tabescens]|uniref:Uncharacterized protein n=1 Tax=Armillaria tabescens TaxID=1929756 RepID=A0AA39K2F5_ARMTA|nr:uncharacterized protein EV420DRAFT_1558989 [Desarmillaria tabescens]KAK0452126.1 hypothetical protein EV420DRAFT_1558989 [Desarmillaria tabescens]
MGNIGIDCAYVAAYLSTFLYGAYVVIAYHCSVVLHRRYRTKRLHMYLLGTHIALFLLITWHCIATMAHTLNGVIHIAPDGIIELQPPWSAWSLVENTPWVMTTIVADAFLVYRTYIVWMHIYLIIFIPLLLFVADIAMGIYFLIGMTNSNTSFQGLTHLTTAFAAVTLSANIVCTALISFRIWMVRRNITETTQGLDPLNGVIVLIVESAAVYTVVLIAQIITLGRESRISFVLFDIQSPIIGIVFSMIIIRVSEGQSHGYTIGTRTAGLAWQHTTTDETAADTEIRSRVIADTDNDDIEAQHPDFRNASTEMCHDSTAYKRNSLQAVD